MKIRDRDATRRTMPETGILVASVSDHAVLRYLERQHGVEIERIRDHIRGLCVSGVRYGAAGVIAEDVKFILQGDVVTTVLKREWHSRDLRSRRED